MSLQRSRRTSGLTGGWAPVMAALIAFPCLGTGAFAQPCDSATLVTAIADGDWSLGTTWSGGTVPDNTPETQYCVTITSHTVTLSSAVTINDLQVGPAGRLRIGAAADASLTIENGGGINAVGTIEVARDSRITALGGTGLTLADSGKYIPDRTVPGAANTTILTTDHVQLDPTTLGESEQMTLADQMQVLVSGDFVMDAADWEDCVVCDCPPGGAKSGP
ncbi:MAG: hypothetical protein PVI86_19040, partial [Phycisphaerae bacterium]